MVETVIGWFIAAGVGFVFGCLYFYVLTERQSRRDEEREYRQKVLAWLERTRL